MGYILQHLVLIGKMTMHLQLVIHVSAEAVLVKYLRVRDALSVVRKLNMLMLI